MFLFKNNIFFILFSLFFAWNNVYAIDANLSSSNLGRALWQKTEGGKVRISFVLPYAFDGSVKKADTAFEVDGILDVDLSEGWKTYWRNPGNSGMAPFFTFADNEQYQFSYPAPQLLKTDDDWAFGYTGYISIPFKITHVGLKQRLAGTLTLGLCKTICMPVEIVFDIDLNNIAGQKNIISKSDWEKTRPLLPEKSNQDFQITKAKVMVTSSEDEVLLVKLYHLADNHAPELFLDGGATEFGIAVATQTKNNETTYRVPILYRTDDWDNQFFYIARNGKKTISGYKQLDK